MRQSTIEIIAVTVGKHLTAISDRDLNCAFEDQPRLMRCVRERFSRIGIDCLSAAEHLLVHTRDPQKAATKLRNYGSIFHRANASVVYYREGLEGHRRAAAVRLDRQNALEEYTS
jgi:histidinol dehydrogenase